MYAPGVGRFAQRDPLGYGAGVGLYAYASNRPNAAVDALGLAPQITFDGDSLEVSGEGWSGTIDAESGGIVYVQLLDVGTPGWLNRIFAGVKLELWSEIRLKKTDLSKSECTATQWGSPSLKDWDWDVGILPPKLSVEGTHSLGTAGQLHQQVTVKVYAVVVHGMYEANGTMTNRAWIDRPNTEWCGCYELDQKLGGQAQVQANVAGVAFAVIASPVAVVKAKAALAAVAAGFKEAASLGPAISTAAGL
jgi:hypothetical protein